jgi:F420-non-reducing hydrogenase iron-sulfur subunit
MEASAGSRVTKILILASLSGGYRGADSVGQLHASYPANTYILPMVSAAMFSEAFYLEAFEKGIDAIIVMFSGTDSPYRGCPEQTARMINRTYPLMKERGIDTRRLRLAAICTVCTAAFLREINQMEAVMAEIGPISSDLAAIPSPPTQPN